MREVVVASGNAGKLREFAAMLSAAGFELVPQSAFGVQPAAEDAPTFIENAIAKARHAARATGRPALADDSGLEVDALAGAPGVHSARFAGPDADDEANNAKLLAALEAVPETQRTARFRAVLVFLRDPDDPVPVIAEGAWEGRIGTQASGSGGFGYDPLFVLADGRTAAELEASEKNRLSHRGRALRALAEKFQS